MDPANREEPARTPDLATRNFIGQDPFRELDRVRKGLVDASEVRGRARDAIEGISKRLAEPLPMVLFRPPLQGLTSSAKADEDIRKSSSGLRQPQPATRPRREAIVCQKYSRYESATSAPPLFAMRVA